MRFLYSKLSLSWWKSPLQKRHSIINVKSFDEFTLLISLSLYSERITKITIKAWNIINDNKYSIFLSSKTFHKKKISKNVKKYIKKSFLLLVKNFSLEFIKVRKANSKDKIQKKENILSDNSVEKIKLFTKN